MPFDNILNKIVEWVVAMLSEKFLIKFAYISRSFNAIACKWICWFKRKLFILWNIAKINQQKILKEIFEDLICQHNTIFTEYIHMLATYEDLRLWELLIRRHDHDFSIINWESLNDNTSLISAAAHKISEVIEFLLEHSANIQQQNWAEWTVLSWVIHHRQTESIKLLCKKCSVILEKQDIIQKALVSRAFVLQTILQTERNSYRNAPQVWDLYQDTDALTVLSHHDINLQHKNKLSKNTLHYITHDNSEVIQFFLEHELHSNCKDRQDMMLLCYAINDLKVPQPCDISWKIYQIVKILIDASTNPLLRCMSQILLTEALFCKYLIHIITCIFSELKREHAEQIYKSLAELQESKIRVWVCLLDSFCKH